LEKRHTDERVGPDAGERPARLPWLLEQRLLKRLSLRVLYFLTGLPEEEIGTDGRAEHRYHHEPLWQGYSEIIAIAA
jgi:hypothetical protein